MLSTSTNFFHSTFTIWGRSIMMRKQKLKKVRWFAQGHPASNRCRVWTEDSGLLNFKTTALNHYLYCLLIHVGPGKLLWVSGTWFLLYLQNRGVGLGLPEGPPVPTCYRSSPHNTLFDQQPFPPTFHSELPGLVPSSYGAADFSLPHVPCHGSPAITSPGISSIFLCLTLDECRF